MKNDKFIIAAAGSGKTTHIVREAIKQKDGQILITTYTQANEEEIRRKFIKENKCIPDNVTIQTWFSFLLQHGVRPYQGSMGLADYEIKGLLLVNEQSTKYIKESDILKYYFTKDHKIFSDKLSKFVVKCNETSKRSIINRLSRLYDYIFIDEVQDLAGYDLDIIKLFMGSNINIMLVGDPRQVTYLTHHEKKHEKYKYGRIKEFIANECKGSCYQLDELSHAINYRCNQNICTFSDKLYPGFNKTVSGNNNKTGHDGIFLVRTGDVNTYLSRYQPIQLRYDSRTCTSETCSTITYGKSKGLEFQRVIIYPTGPVLTWLKNRGTSLEPGSRAKLYVAITRAISSVAFIYNYTDNEIYEDIEKWNP